MFFFWKITLNEYLSVELQHFWPFYASSYQKYFFIFSFEKHRFWSKYGQNGLCEPFCHC